MTVIPAPRPDIDLLLPGDITADPATGAAVAAAWQGFEAPLFPHQYAGPPPKDTVLRVAPSRRPELVLTAPHAVAHHRGLRRKGADVASGGLAWLVAHRVGSRALIAGSEQSRDGNRDADGVFKDAFRAELGTGTAAVVDVHGMTDSFGYDVCLGTGHDTAMAAALLEPMRAHLLAAGLRVSVNDPWAASAEHTITNTAHRAGLPAVQVEVARAWRQPWEEPRQAARMVHALAGALEAALRVLPATSGRGAA